MRRKDREMDENFALSVVDTCPYAVLAAASPDGAPYSVPLSIVREGENIYFHCALEGQKVALLRENPRVCLTCVGETRLVPEHFTTEYASALVFGDASPVTEAEEKAAALRLICRRYAKSNLENMEAAIRRSLDVTGIWKIHIRSITGKRKKYDDQGREMKFGPRE